MGAAAAALHTGDELGHVEIFGGFLSGGDVEPSRAGLGLEAVKARDHGAVDELDISIAPVIMGGGERLFAGLAPGALRLTQIRAVEAPGVTHIKYRIG